MVTRRGLALASLAALAFAAGALRADLAGLFWGSSFLLVPLYGIAAGQVLRLLLRRRRDSQSGILTVHLPSSGLVPGEEAAAHLRAELPRSFAPGLTVRFLLPLSWQERRLDCIAARLSPGKTDRDIPFRAGQRGVYRSEKAFLEIGDVLGFTASRLPIPVRETLTVFPAQRESRALQRPLEEGGDAVVHLRRKRRAEDLLEVRKYFPGDDVRKLNWKLFAHLDQLFIRLGEETPPPDSRVLFILDTAANPTVPRQLAGGYLDRLVESCASAMASLLARRVDISLAAPGVTECRSFTEESRPALLAQLADAAWSDPEWPLALPGRRAMHAVVFSSPGSPALRRILSAVMGRGWAASLFLQELGAVPAPRAPSLRSLLFQSGNGPAPSAPSAPSAPTRRQAASFEEAMDRDLAAFRSPPWTVRHAGKT